MRVQRPRAPIDPVSDTEQAFVGGVDERDEPVFGFEHEGEPDHHIPLPGLSDTAPRVVTLPEDIRGVIEQLKFNQDQTDQRLAGIQDVLKNNARIMVKLHNHTARVSGFILPCHEFVHQLFRR